MMRVLRAAWGAAIVVAMIVVVLVSARPAHADERDDAKRAFADGQAADKRKDYRAAIEHYLRAYDLVPHPFALYNIGAAYEQLGKFKEAAHYYTLYLASPDASDRARIQKLLADLKTRPSRVLIRSTPEGGRVTIDGRVAGMTPHAASLKGGQHKIVVDKDDERDEKIISVEFGEPAEVTLTVTSKTGTLFVNAYPVGAQVTVDGVVAGTSPVQVPLPVGSHTVVIMSQGFSPLATTVVVAPGMINEIRPRLTNALGGIPPDVGAQVLQINYMVGVGAGLDVSSIQPAYGFELGLRGKQFEIALVIGEVSDLNSVELQVRYALTKGRLAPILGGGYSYVGAGAGYEAVAGLRYELASSARAGVGLMALVAARWSVGDPMNDDPAQQEAFWVLPVGLTLQAYYH